MDRLNVIMAALMLGASMLMTFLMGKKKIFHGRGIAVLIIGVFLYLFYAWTVCFTGLSVNITAMTYRKLLSFSVFSVTLFLAARIIIAYGWKIELVMIACFVLGITIVAAYIINFDNFGFISSLGNIFNKYGRYRYSFGLGHVNAAGRYALCFLSLASVYRTYAEEKNQHQPRRKRDKFKTFFLIPTSIIAILMLLSTASRTSITALILFFMVYEYLTFYSYGGGYIRVLVIMSSVMAAAIIIAMVNWAYVFEESSRMINYTSLDVIFGKNVWLTGLGFMWGGEELFAVLGLRVMDGFYLTTFLSSGLIGFVLLIGSILWFARIYFTNPANMTKSQRITGALLAVYLYYALFESTLFGVGAVEMASWMLFITEMNERAAYSIIVRNPH